MSSSVLLHTSFDTAPSRRGKVRDIYDLGDRLLLVSTDRISAFDWVMPNGIPDKGRLLTQLSVFWLQQWDVPHHLITTELDNLPAAISPHRDALEGRSMIVRKAQVVPIECVVRGYLSGSGWKEYQRHGTVCGLTLPAGLSESARLEQPIFTPATKAESGHDENMTFEQTVERIGSGVAEELRQRSLELYHLGAEPARERGILIADTKFEWGFDGDRLILVDEVFTPDSSRFWPAEDYEAGRGQSSFDKQFLRDWLESTHWDKESPPPTLPDEIIHKTRARYVEAFQRLTGATFPTVAAPLPPGNSAV